MKCFLAHSIIFGYSQSKPIFLPLQVLQDLVVVHFHVFGCWINNIFFTWSVFCLMSFSIFIVILCILRQMCNLFECVVVVID